MIDHPATATLFNPTIENGMLDDVADAFQTMHSLPIPWVKSSESPTRSVPGRRRIAIHHRHGARSRRWSRQQVTPGPSAPSRHRIRAGPAQSTGSMNIEPSAG